MEDLIEDLVKFHYTGKEHLLAQDIIKQNKKFAEALYFELQMQLYLNEVDEETETMILED